MKLGCLVLFLCGIALEAWSQSVVVLRYAHMNNPASNAGIQAEYFARKVEEYSKGSIRIEVYPSSLLGTLSEQVDQVVSGTVAIHHNTAAAFGDLVDDFAVLDTPYLYRDVEHLLKVTDPFSPVMKKLGEKLLKEKGLRILYTYYFGTRELTCDRPIYGPQDLSGVKIRAIPYSMYQAAVEALGAIPAPIDWALTPTALAAKVVSGQENPVNIILSARLYEFQKYLMLTDHLRSSHIVVVNEGIWKKLSKQAQDQLYRAAKDAAEYGTELTVEQEESDKKALLKRGMTIIGAADGLDIDAFRNRAEKIVTERFKSKWEPYYKMIESMK